MITVKMPDGVNLDFPDDTPNEKIQSVSANYWSKQQAPPKESKSGFETVKGALSSREAFEMYGSAAGGVLGSAVTPFVGTAAGAGLGAGAGGQIHDLLFGNAGTGAEQAQKAAKDITIEGATALVAPKIMQTGADLVQKGLTPAAKSLSSKVLGMGKVGASGKKDLALMEKHGIPFDASLVDEPNLQMLGTSLRSKPGSNVVLQKADREKYGAIQGLFDETAEKLGGSKNAGSAGDLLKEVSAENKKKFFDVADKLYSKVEGFLPERIGVPELKTFAEKRLAELTSTTTEAGQNAEAINTLKNVLDDIGDVGALDADKIRSFKRLSKAAFEKSPLSRTDSDKVLMEMRGVFGKDIDNAVEDFGGKEGKKALKAANKWWKSGVGTDKGKPGTLKTYEDIASKEEGADALTYAIQNVFKKRGGADKLKRVLAANPEAKEELSSYVFREMGGGDTFNFNKFLTNFDKMPKSVRKVLFKGTDIKLGELKRVAEMAASLEKNKNFSNTENLRVFNQLLDPISKGFIYGGSLGAVRGATITSAGIAKNIATAKLMTNPKFVTWLVDTSKKTIVDPKKLPALAGRLSLMATGMPKQEGEAVLDYISQLGFNTKKTYDQKENLKKVEVK